ncbi:hypothetical protein [Actinophytocola oryzae]|uniref:hypothetical protein n=1 Tax=Actinophytocola oryzae TaxID=502181 RepID=UPI001063BA5C|nr:hypothetical protein [Actinophytocola oryzae]
MLIATAVGLSGLFGASPEDLGHTVRATIVTGASCSSPDATSTVKFTVSGRLHEARYDGCGHARNEPVDVTVPVGVLPADLVVHASDAATGDREDGQGLGLLLIVLSCVAGAGYAFLVRRGPRTTRLPAPLRL